MKYTVEIDLNEYSPEEKIDIMREIMQSRGIDTDDIAILIDQVYTETGVNALRRKLDELAAANVA